MQYTIFSMPRWRALSLSACRVSSLMVSDDDDDDHDDDYDDQMQRNPFLSSWSSYAAHFAFIFISHLVIAIIDATSSNVRIVTIIVDCKYSVP
mmetsp:Transcript_32637/g.39046  ORF Transcript_32637/g.39046 Transcript_32637/m.39046 type:complete len:93 (-) Transcript_32637:285-563(-)